MWRCWSLALLGAATCVGLATTAGSGQEGPPLLPSTTPLGFAPATRAAELAAEANAVTVPTPNQARSWLRTLTEEPHVAGTPADLKTAEFVRDKLREWGWKADLAEYEVLLNYPNTQVSVHSAPAFPSLKLIRPSAQTLSTMETPLASDKDSASPAAFPAFHGYGVSGNVTGQVVYANFGRPEDFAALEKIGVDVKDKIVLVRYGELFRGLKVRTAQKRGAKGVLIYSDPAEDGYGRGDVYPQGPYRPDSAIQRGSVQFLSIQPGDPSTPGWASVKDAKRLPMDWHNGFPLFQEKERIKNPARDNLLAQEIARQQAGVQSIEEWEKETGLKRLDYFPAIPALPISYGMARPIFEALGGPNVPHGWQGGLPLPYHVGPGPAEVEFVTMMDYQVRPVWNVIATIPGTVERDRWVLIGNHRDAWVYGAVDPGSGTAATLEMCRAIGAAVKQGWKPRRTLVYASWDAEEYGLVGSTEWAEDHAKELDAKAVLMLNVDSAVSGHEIDLDGIPSLRDWVLDAAAAVSDVRSGKTLRQTWLAKQREDWASQQPVDLPDLFSSSNNGNGNGNGPIPESAAARPAGRFAPQMQALGSGSDYTAFVDHLGVPAVDIGFKGRYGVYHSVYDNFTWMEKVGDPEFITHAMAARFYTVLAMRAAAAEVVPLKFVPYGEALHDSTDDLRRMIERKARAAEPGATGGVFHFAGLAGLVRAIRGFQDQAAALDRATDELARRDNTPREKLSRVNDALSRIERAFLLSGGLPARPWFKHAIYAPGLTTGYASWPLPGLRHALVDNDPTLFAAQTAALTARIEAATNAMRDAAEAAR
jgi:N-acetylated-alpha-linked acidic dipeptidase